jgi:hypothetical protein
MHGARGLGEIYLPSALPGGEWRPGDAVQMSSIEEFKGEMGGIFDGNKKDVKLIVDVVISSNAEQS